MNCTEIRKQIQEYLDGDAEFASFGAHLDTCADCRKYYEQMLRQRSLLRSLAPVDVPKFDLTAAKRRKRSSFSRAVRWASAAAAVFAVVILTHSMGIFRAKSAEISENAVSADTAMDVVEDALDGGAEYDDCEYCTDDVAPPEQQEEPNTLTGTTNSTLRSEEIVLTFSAEEYDAVLAALRQNGFSPTAEDDRISFDLTAFSAVDCDTLATILDLYTEVEISPETNILRIEKE